MIEACTEHCQGFLENVHEGTGTVGLQECTKRSSAYDQHLKWLKQRTQLTVRQNEAANHTGENNNDADDFDHGI